MSWKVVGLVMSGLDYRAKDKLRAGTNFAKYGFSVNGVNRFTRQLFG